MKYLSEFLGIGVNVEVRFIYLVMEIRLNSFSLSFSLRKELR